MKKLYKLNQNHLRYLKKRVKYWQNTLGLIDIEFGCELREEKDPGVYATYERYSKTGYTDIFLNSKVNKYTSEKSLDKTAFHEVFESGYFSELRAMARGTYADYEVEFHTHTAVRKAENTIFKRLRNG